MIKKYIFIAAAMFSLSSCAHVPNAEVGYYLPKSKVDFKVIRTVVCDEANHPNVVNSATPNVTHSADKGQFVQIPLSGLKGIFSDTDVKFEFYEDGRLKNVNATSAGQGETILKTVVTIAAAAFAFEGGTPAYPKQCAFIKAANGGKPLTLTYEGTIDFSNKEPQNINADITSAFYSAKLEDAVGHVCAVVESVEVPKEVPLKYKPKDGDVLLKALQPGSVRLKVFAGGANECKGKIWDGSLPVAQFGTLYTLPLPAPTIFGKEVLSASFAESGAITTIQYTSNAGAGQALNVANSGFTAIKGETTAQKAADVKAEADLIAQQQRLAQCMADPINCK